MSSTSHIANRPRWPSTLALSVLALALGIPIAAAALSFERTPMPNVILGSKTIKTAPGETKTITFSLLSGANDAVSAAAYISIISSAFFVIGMVVVRHVSQHNVFGWAMLFPALVAFGGNVACMVYAYIASGKNGAAAGGNGVTYDNGAYQTGGKLFTREAWACMMNEYFRDREGEWAQKACDGFKTGRMLTIPMVVASVALVALALWQVQRRGGIAWLMGRRATIAAMSRGKADYIDLQGRN